MKTCTIDGKEYEVKYVFNMVGNYYFIREGVAYLVDAEDVREWVRMAAFEGADPSFKSREDAAIGYADFYAENSEDGSFWWTTKDLEQQ